MAAAANRFGEQMTHPVARRGEAGNALVVALLVLLVLTSAGVAFVAVTKSEKQIAGNAVAATEALYTAEAGITEGLYRMAFSDSTTFIGQKAQPTPGWGRYIVLANGASLLDPDGKALQTDGLDNNANGFVDESNERYPEVLTQQTGGQRLRYPYVRVEYKMQGAQLIRFGDDDNDGLTLPRENLVNGAPVLRLTASGREGNASKTLEAEAVRFPLLNVGAAIWAGNKIAFNGNAFLVDGYDHQATAPYDTIPGAKAVPGILTEGPTTDVNMQPNQEDNIVGEGGENSVEQSPFGYDFNQLWGQLSGMAKNAFSGDQSWGNATPHYGSLNDPQVTVVKGTLKVAGTWQGGGILMVDGNLEMGGGCMFTGVVIATGDVKLTGGGPADMGRIVGGLIYQGTMIGGSSQGGAGRLWYSSQAVNSALTLNRYTLAWWRER